MLRAPREAQRWSEGDLTFVRSPSLSLSLSWFAFVTRVTERSCGKNGLRTWFAPSAWTRAKCTQSCRDIEAFSEHRRRPELAVDWMAERAGFEPAIQFPVYGTFNAAPSATRPPLHRTCVETSLCIMRY